jgi:hypothetical protein
VAAGAAGCLIAAGAAVGALVGVAAGAQAASANVRMDVQASKTFAIIRVFMFLLLLVDRLGVAGAVGSFCSLHAGRKNFVHSLRYSRKKG